MPVFSPNAPDTHAIAPTTNADGRRGEVPGQFALLPDRGIPRYEDLLSLRVLERQPTVALPLNTVRTQVTTPDWGFRPTVDSPSTAHNEVVDELTEFFDGNFNPNNQSFNNLLKLWVTDMLSPDAGTLELVPSEPDANGNRWLSEIWHLDGITMTKQLDEHGRIPDPPDAAYYQFSPRSALSSIQAQGVSWGDVVDRLGSKRSLSILRSYGQRRHEPIEFSRDQVVWVERNPQAATNYGFGKVQQVRHWAEILLNVDISNASYFSANEIPQGIMRINAGSETELERARDYFRDTIKGQTDHIAPMFDAPSGEDLEWIPIQGTPEELQFLDSQQWYHKLVWFLFGLNQGEIGDFESGNRSMGEYHGRQVFRQTTRPLLDDIVEAINQQILPKTEAYQRIDGEVEFFINVEHEQMQKLERQRQQQDLEANLRTPNEVRNERGKEEVPWGDVPQEVITSVARQQPVWALEHWGGVDEEDLPEDMPGNLDLLSARRGPDATERADPSLDTADDDAPDADGGGGEPGNALPDGETRQDEDAGEIGEEFPAVEDLVADLQDTVSATLDTALRQLGDDVAEVWPEEGADESLVVDVDRVVETLDVQDDLLDPVVEANGAAMQAAADEEAERLEAELEDRFGLVPEVAQIDLDFDLTDTFAWEAMRRRAARNMVSVEDSVRDQIRTLLLDAAEDGAGVSEVTSRLDEAVPEISRERSRLVARTELPQSSREGTQALGEATDAVGGKEWDATGDGRTRPWHDAMDGEVVPVDDSWTVPSGWQGEPDYQPSDYPRTAFTVGEDQPFNCRCLQRNVLEEDLPEDVRALDEWAGVSVDVHLTERQFEVWSAHAEDGESMGDLLERVDSAHSRNQGAPDLLGVGKEAYYNWLREFDLY